MVVDCVGRKIKVGDTVVYHRPGGSIQMIFATVSKVREDGNPRSRLMVTANGGKQYRIPIPQNVVIIPDLSEEECRLRQKETKNY